MEIKEVGKIRKEKGYVTSLVYIPTKKLIVSTSLNECDISFWDYESSKLLKLLKYSKTVNDILVWDYDFIISCTDEGKIDVISTSNFEVVKSIDQFLTSYSPVFNLLKLNDDEFIATGKFENPVIVFSFSTGRILRNIDSTPISFNVASIISLQHKNCFYLSCGSEYTSKGKVSGVYVALLNHQKNEIFKKFSKHLFRMNSLELFQNSAGEEILLGSSSSEKFIYFYNSLTEECFMKINLNGEWISTLLVFHNYLLVGQETCLRIFYLSGEKRCRFVVESVVHEDLVRCICPVDYNNLRTMKLCSSSDDGTIRKFEIENCVMNLHLDIHKKDVIERIQFLFDKVEEIFENVENCFLFVQLFNTRVENFCKSIYLL